MVARNMQSRYSIDNRSRYKSWQLIFCLAGVQLKKVFLWLVMIVAGNVYNYSYFCLMVHTCPLSVHFFWHWSLQHLAFVNLQMCITRVYYCFACFFIVPVLILSINDTIRWLIYAGMFIYTSLRKALGRKFGIESSSLFSLSFWFNSYTWHKSYTYTTKKQRQIFEHTCTYTCTHTHLPTHMDARRCKHKNTIQKKNQMRANIFICSCIHMRFSFV